MGVILTVSGISPWQRLEITEISKGFKFLPEESGKNQYITTSLENRYDQLAKLSDLISQKYPRAVITIEHID